MWLMLLFPLEKKNKLSNVLFVSFHVVLTFNLDYQKTIKSVSPQRGDDSICCCALIII